MQPDLRFIDRLTKKPSKRNRDLVLKYAAFAMLSCKHPASLQIFSKTPSEYIFFGGGFSLFLFFSLSFVAVSNSAEFATRTDTKHGEKTDVEVGLL